MIKHSGNLVDVNVDFNCLSIIGYAEKLVNHGIGDRSAISRMHVAWLYMNCDCCIVAYISYDKIIRCV